MIEIKKTLYNYCNEYVENSISLLEKEMNAMQQAANSELKGSAGDKHETGRAMMHIEKEKVAKQLADRLQLRKSIAQLHPSIKNQSAQLGSLIRTNNGMYYLAIAIGKVIIDNDEFFIISPISPIGKILLGCKKGDSITFNKKEIKIDQLA